MEQGLSGETMIERVYVLVSVRENGEEVVDTNTKLDRIKYHKQQLEWSFIQNTGRERTDLRIVTFARVKLLEGLAMTEEQARNLKPGTKVWMQTYTYGGSYWTEWTVYMPTPEQRWDSDPTVLNYIFDPASGLIGYIFSHRLHMYSLKKQV